MKKFIHALYLSVILAAFAWWLDFSLDSRFDDMNATMNSRFDVVHQDLRQLEQKMDRKFEKVDERFEKVDEKFEKINEKLETMDKRLLRMELNFEYLNAEHKWLVPTVRRIESDVAELKAGER